MDHFFSDLPANWPLVDPKDDGIRLAGAPDQCFYCQKRVGESHARDCVIVQKRVEMEVLITWPEGAKTKDGQMLVGTKSAGLWQFDEPHFWDAHQSTFHKNDSSWCANNFVHQMDGGDDEGSSTTLDEATKTQLRALYERCEKINALRDDDAAALDALESDGEPFIGCLCSVLSFKLVRVVDDTPKRKLRP